MQGFEPLHSQKNDFIQDSNMLQETDLNNNFISKEQLARELSELNSLYREQTRENAQLKSLIEALRDSKQKFLTAIRNMNIIPSQFDTDLRYCWIYNPHLDFEPGSVIGKRDDEIDDSLGAQCLVQLKRQVIDSGVGVRHEISFQRSNGTRTYDFMIEPLRDANGSIIGGTSSAYDVTDRKKAEQRLEKSLERAQKAERTLNALMECIPEGITIAEAPGVRIQMVSRYGRELTGKSRQVLEGITADCHAQNWQLFQADGKTPADNNDLPLTRATQKGEVVTDEEYVLLHSDGRRIPILCNAGPILDENGQVLGGVIAWRDITERKKAEQALRESQKRYRTLFNTMLEGFCIIEVIFDAENRPSDYRFLEVNPAFKQQSGLSDVVGRKISEIVPDFGAYWVEMYGRVALTGRPERSIRQAQGFDRWFDANAYRLGGPESRQVAVVFTDVSQYMKTQEALRTANEQYRQQVRLFEGVASTTPDFVYLFDSQGRFVYANCRLLEVWGMKLPEVIGKTCQELGYEQWHHDMHMREIAQVIETRQSIKGEVSFKAPLTGISGVYEYIFTPVIGSIGEVELIAATTRDVTDRKRTEDALRESEERFRTMADGLPLIVWVHDAEGRQQFVNQTFLDYFGVTHAEMRDGRWQLLMHPDDAKAYADEFYACVGERRPFHAQTRVRRSDGNWHWIESWGRPRLSPAGEYLGYVGTSADISERKTADEALRQSEGKFRSLFDSMSEGFVVGKMIYDAKGRAVDYQFTEVNRAYEQLTGIDRDESLKKTVRQLIPDLEPTWIENHARVVETGEPRRWDNYNARTDGSYEIFTYRPVPGMFASIFSNVSERKKAERALKDSERLFHAAIDQFPGVFNIYDAQRRLTYLNSEAIRFMGLSAEQMIGNRDEEFVPSEVCSQYLPFLEEVYRTRKPGNFELHFPDSFGGTIHNAQYVPILDNRGDIQQVLGILTDITEQKQTQELLAQSLTKAKEGERTLEALMAYVPEGIAIATAPDVRIQNISRYGVEMIGTTKKELFSFTVKDIANVIKFFEPDGTIAAVEDLPLIKATKHAEVVKDRELVIASLDGRRIPVLCNAAPLLDETGAITGGIIAWRDITEQKKIESQLRKVNEKLEQRVAERTLLAENRAMQLQSLAVELIEAEEKERQRVAQILHDDLQQLLAAARMQLEVACESLPSNAFLGNILSLLKESIEKSRRLSHELSPPVLHHADLAGALEWLQGQVLEQFGLAVELKINGQPPDIAWTMKVFIFRAAQELLFNVVKHAYAASATVILNTQKDKLSLCVFDQGKGFDIHRINSPSPKTGIGLVSLKERARSIGGDLLTESTPGRGSRFTLTLPLDKALSQPISPATDLQVQKNSKLINEASKLRILFVDDHKVMRQGLIKLLSGQPNIHVAGEAATGREAIRLSLQLRPDLILMDISMPDVDGIEATRTIKRELPDVRIIGLSMHDDKQVGSVMINAGAEAFLSKSVSTAELLKTIYGITSEQKTNKIKNESEN
jgi:PAS domain S-box-containing protein